MDPQQIRQAVEAMIASIAPEGARARVAPDRPLRGQVDLDSMDWLSLLDGLQARLDLRLPPSALDADASVEDIVAAFAACATTADPTPPAAPASVLAALFPCTHRLADGSTVTLRPLRAADAALEAAFVAHLSNESRYKRFMVTLRELPREKLRQLTDVDGVGHVALVATVRRDAGELALGVARYVVDAGGGGCEFAIAVDDAWQRSGLAGVLMHTLIAIARSRGLARMHGDVLAANRRMLAFARQLGFSLQRDPADGGIVRVTRAL